MLTLVTGIPNSLLRSRSSGGFTLIEILIVVIIIGTIATVAMLSINLAGDDRDLHTEARRLMSLIEVAEDDATLQGREFGIELMHNSYRFVEYDGLNRAWADIPGDDLLRPRTLPEEFELQLFLEDKRVLLDTDPKPFNQNDASGNALATETYSPHLLVYSSGELTPFELHLIRPYDDKRVIVRGDALGDLRLGVDEDDFDDAI